MKGLFRWMSPGGEEGRLTVLIFHRVVATVDPLFPDEVDAERFDQIVGWLTQWFRILPLDEAARCLKEGCLPPRAAVLTFDDGYADNEEIALPLLRKHQVPCSFFIATGFLDGGRMWNDTLIESVRLSRRPVLDLRGLRDGQGQDLGEHALADVGTRRAALGRLIERVKYLPPDDRLACVAQIAERAEVRPPDDLMMTSEQVRSLRRAGMQIGAHTVSHPILASLTPAQAADEIAGSRAHLESILGEQVTLFAYPNGRPGTDYLPDVHPGLVRELGFSAAVSTRKAIARRQDDVFQIPRFTPWDRGRAKFGLRLLRALAAG